jgi:hypothetical protein
MADRPWWREWTGVPPSMERRLAHPHGPLTATEVWAARLGGPLVLAFAVGLGLAVGAWGGVGVAVFFPLTQWLRMTPQQRRQVLGRADR